MQSERGFKHFSTISDSEQVIDIEVQKLNKITTPFPNEHTILVPLYVRACMRELVSVNADDESAVASFDFYVTFPFSIDPAVAKRLSMDREQAQDLERFLQNNITLEIGESFVDISQEITFQLKNEPLPDRRLLAGIIRSVLKGEQFEKDDDEEQELDREAEESRKNFFYTRRHEYPGYATYLVSGKFKCEGNLESHFFPYHEITLSPVLRVLRMIYKDTAIKYSFMRLQDENWQVKQFVFGPELPALGRFGIYEVTMGWRRMEGGQEEQERRQSWSEGGVRPARSVSFCFKIHSFNVPFILRNQVPLWVLCLASFALNFANIAEISNVFGNVILISVAQISLLSNFRKSSFRTEFGGLYELTLGGFIIVSLLQIMVETRQFYVKDGDGMISEDGWFFQSSYVICLVMLALNLGCLLTIGCVHNSKKGRSRRQVKHELMALEWDLDDFTNCLPLTSERDRRCLNICAIFD